MNEETKKLNEDVLNEQPQAPVAAPVQADPAEVQAAQQQAAPAQPVEQPLVDETQVVPEQPVEEQPETVSIEMQIPTDQLAAAVAQVTGDMEAAETAPDITAEKESEIAAVEAPEAPAEEIPTEAPSEDVIVESLSEEEKNVIREYRKYKASKIKESEDIATGEAAEEVVVEDEKEDMAAGAPAVDEAEPSPIQESLEDEAEEAEADMAEEDFDNGEIEGGDEFAEDALDPNDVFSEEEGDLSDYEEMGIDDEDEGELVDQLHSIFADEDEVEDTAEALRTSADFLDSILAMDDDLADEEEEETEDFEDDEDFEEESAFEADGVDDTDEIEVEEEVEEEPEEMKESIVYPAGSRPINSAISNSEYDDNLVKAYESSAAARRKALANFRETMKKNSAASANRAKFNEALSGSSKMKETTIDPRSWKANRFEDKMEEREQLDYKALLRNGFLG